MHFYMSLSLVAKKGTKETLGGFSVGRKLVWCRSDVTPPTPRIIQDGLELYSLNNSMVQSNRVNSVLGRGLFFPEHNEANNQS